VSLVYADTSALATAYLPDEARHPELRRLLLEGVDEVVTSAVTRVEVASTVSRAVGARRAGAAQRLLERFDADCEDDGPLTLVGLDPHPVLARAYEIVLVQRLRALDAIHLAVAIEEHVDAFVTRDAHQARAAAGLGLAVI
jgi:uncharacterized protein